MTGVFQPETFLSDFCETVNQQPGWADAYRGDARVWTSLATSATVRAALKQYPHLRPIARTDRGPSGRAEYLTLDACLLNWEDWSHPVAVAEHENMIDRSKVQYCTWKLTAVRADVRVLFAYYGSGTGIATLEALEAAVREVVEDGGGEVIYLFAGRHDARPSTLDTLRASYSITVIAAGAANS